MGCLRSRKVISTPPVRLLMIGGARPDFKSRTVLFAGVRVRSTPRGRLRDARRSARADSRKARERALRVRANRWHAGRPKGNARLYARK